MSGERISPEIILRSSINDSSMEFRHESKVFIKGFVCVKSIADGIINEEKVLLRNVLNKYFYYLY